MKNNTMGKKLINTIKQLYAKASSALLVQGTVGGEWFHTSIGVRQGCPSHRPCSTSSSSA